MVSAMDCLRLLFMAVVVWEVRCCQAEEWCFNTTRYYTRSVAVPNMLCRPIRCPLGRGNCRRSRLKVPGTVIIGDSAEKQKTVTKIRDNKVTAKEVMKTYPGLFLTREKAIKVQKDVFKPFSGIPRRGRRPDTGSSDGDIHCPTFRKLIEAPETMTDIQSTTRTLVHFPSEGVFQYIHSGKCGSADGQQSCSGGGCFQEKSIVYLMVWTDSASWPTGFEPFEFESYCSCKGVQ